MIQEIQINSLDGIFDLITQPEQTNAFGRYRSLYVYRGLPNIAFHLQTSLQRNCKNKSRALEPNILNNFKKYAQTEDPSIDRSVWRQMILGQHHGLPTRLLDWTHSQLVALHFAMSEYDMDQLDKHDCVIWRIDIKEFDDLLPDKYQAVRKKVGMDVFSVDMLTEVCNDLFQYDEDMQHKSMIVIEPPSIDPRIVNQYSFFSVVPSGISDIEKFFQDSLDVHVVKYIISKDIRWRVRDILDETNMNERMIYPGLDGISKWIARHYFVKGQE